MLLSAGASLLLVVDVQERLAPAIEGGAAVIERVRTLIRAARLLDIPVLATEQYPRGLGPTVAEVAALLPPGAVLEKIHFSCAAEPGFLDRVRAFSRPQILVAGTEAHVCVLQTAFGLKEAGFSVHVAADAVGSRDPANRSLALDRMRLAGIPAVSTEMAVFEWLHRADHPVFKDVLALIK